MASWIVFGITGTPGFIVGTELVPGAVDVKGLRELIVRVEATRRR